MFSCELLPVSYSQCPIPASWLHPPPMQGTGFLVCLESGLQILGRKTLSVLFSQFLTHLSLRLKICQTQTLWFIIGWSSLGSFSIPEWCWKEVGERWKHPSSLDQPDLLDQAGSKPSAQQNKWWQPRKGERGPISCLAHVSGTYIVQSFKQVPALSGN